jgi:hypothetical protein
MSAVFQRNAAGSAAANSERRGRLRPPAMCRWPLCCPVVIEGRQSGQGGSLLSADMTELGHVEDERQGGALADTGHALNQVEAAGEIVMPA